jgi:hypothetical protein
MLAAPWRDVQEAYIRTNRKQLGRVLGRILSREWVMTLTCGHQVYRYLKVPEGPEPFFVREAKVAANPPKRVRCKMCPHG